MHEEAAEEAARVVRWVALVSKLQKGKTQSGTTLDAQECEDLREFMSALRRNARA